MGSIWFDAMVFILYFFVNIVMGKDVIEYKSW